MKEERQIVWENKLDDRYDCKVERIAAYDGELVMMEGETEILRQPVTLSYQALFGPDVADVALWQQILIKKADERA